MIENFSLLSPEEQQQFAAELVAKLNAAKVFSDDSDLTIYDIDTDEMDGSIGIAIGVETAIDRDAYWQCGDSEEAYDMPEHYDFTESSSEDAKKAFKTLATDFEGYILELREFDIEDYDVEGVSEVYDIENEDAGIGSYEYWGDTGYDSQPYCEVNGSLDVSCGISAWLVVTPK